MVCELLPTGCVTVVVLLLRMQILLILQYSYLTVARCLCIPGDGSSDSSGSGASTGCVWVLKTDPTTTRHVFDILGLQTTSVGVLPLFLIYLAVLMYNYQLGSNVDWDLAAGLTDGPALRTATNGSSTQLAPPPDANNAGGSASLLHPFSGADSEAGDVSSGGGRGAGGAVMLMVALQGWAGQLWTLCRLLLLKLAYHMR